MYSASLELSISCPKCDSSIILNGPTKTAHCNACQNDVSISSDFWKSIFETVLEDIVTDLEEGYGRNSTIFGEFNTRLLYGNVKPRCGDCKKSLDVIEINVDNRTKIKCSNCGKETNISPSPKWLKKVLPAANYFVNAITTKEDIPQTDLIDGVALTCPRCGGSLIVDGKERIIPCEYCNLHVYLPDDLWLRLHPVLVKDQWFIVYDKDEVGKLDFD